LTLLLVEHRLDEWVGLVDRTLVMDAEGRVVREGLPRACFGAGEAALTAQGIWMPTVSKLAFELRSPGARGAGELPVTEEQFIEEVGPLPGAIAFLEERLRPPAAAEHSTASGSTLSVRGLSVRLGQRTVLHAIDLEFHPGELTAIVGANGSGKTTLLQHMAGIGGKDAAGGCMLDGRPLSDWPQRELRRRIGYVFQNPEHQFVTFTVWDELAFGLKLQGASQRFIEAEVPRLLRLSGLAGFEAANPFSLSQGQKRRLSVATMLADEQRWLLLDEPTFGQDARTSEQLMTMLRDRVHAGMSVVMVSHDMEAVQRYAHRVVLLADGRVRYDGDPAGLWSRSDILAAGGVLPPVAYRLLTGLTTRHLGGDIDAALRLVESGR
jgi:energy-coupling factor transport system ATP-binding protein